MDEVDELSQEDAAREMVITKIEQLLDTEILVDFTLIYDLVGLVPLMTNAQRGAVAALLTMRMLE